MPGFLIRNPEFRRNLLMELSPNRMVLMPLVLSAIFFLTYYSNKLSNPMEALKNISAVILGGLVFAWGGKQASESVISEVNGNTWDFQRMTSIGPWEMSMGKLFGSTIYPWYGAGFCMVVYLFAAFNLPTPWNHVKLLLALVLGGVFSHAMILSMSLMGIKKYRSREKINSSGYFAVAILLLFFFLSIIVPIYENNGSFVNWYLFHLSVFNCFLFSVLFFLFWSILNIYRNMRIELQLANGPWVWVLFMICLMLYCSGFLANFDELGVMSRFVLGLWLSYIIGITVTYFTAFNEPKNMVDFRAALDKIKNRKWSEAGEILPLWGFSLVLSVILLGAISLMAAFSFEVKFPGQKEALTSFYLFNLLCFLVRDLSLLIYVNLKSNSSRADLAAFFYLLILYILIPLILGVTEIKEFIPAFVPTPDSHFLDGTLPPLLQALFMVYLLARRWKDRVRLMGP